MEADLAGANFGGAKLIHVELSRALSPDGLLSSSARRRTSGKPSFRYNVRIEVCPLRICWKLTVAPCSIPSSSTNRSASKADSPSKAISAIRWVQDVLQRSPRFPFRRACFRNPGGGPARGARLRRLRLCELHKRFDVLAGALRGRTRNQTLECALAETCPIARYFWKRTLRFMGTPIAVRNITAFRRRGARRSS